MIFPYSSIISAVTPDGDFVVVHRPEIPATVVGPAGSGTYIGLVDTGSDQTILPKSLARDLGILIRSTAGPAAQTFGGHDVHLEAGEVTLQISADGEVVTWKTTISFFDFAAEDEETILLGHAGFLDYFIATFDGKLGTLTLIPNDDLPTGDAAS
jgi:hypothetical protein